MPSHVLVGPDSGIVRALGQYAHSYVAQVLGLDIDICGMCDLKTSSFKFVTANYPGNCGCFWASMGEAGTPAESQISWFLGSYPKVFYRTLHSQ